MFETWSQTPLDIAETIVECQLFDVTSGAALMPNFNEFLQILKYV